MRWNASSTWPRPIVSLTNRFEVDPARQVVVDENREVPGGEAVAVPAGLERPASAEELDHGQLEGHRRVRHAHQHQPTGQVAAVERLHQRLGPPDGLDGDVHAQIVGQRLDRLDRILLRRVDRVGGSELAGPLQFSGVDVDGDDLAGAGDSGTGDGGVTDAATPEDGDRLAPLHLAGVDRGAEAGHDPATDETGRLGWSRRVDLHALRRRPPASSRRRRRSPAPG